MKPKVKVVYSPYHRLHVGTGPELPERVDVVWRSLEVEREIFEPKKASEKQILKVHTKNFLDVVKKLDKKAKSLSQYFFLVNNNKKYQRVIDGTCIVRGSFEAACYACGSTIEAMKDAYKAVFVLLRPPSHHSHKNFTHGFCIFNNTCVGIENSKSRNKRILIVDLDLHFGDGVYFFFRKRKNIRYISFSFIRLNKQLELLKRPTIKDLNNLVSSFDHQILYVILGYDSLDFGYMKPEEFFELLKNVLKHASPRKLVMELSGGYDQNKLPTYVKKSLEMADKVL